MEKFRLDFMGEGVAAILTAIQPNEVYQIVSLVLTIIGIIVSLAYTIWKWYREAKADGKITPEEIDDLADKINKFKGDKK